MKPGNLGKKTKRRAEFLAKWAFRLGVFHMATLVYLVVLISISMIPLPIGRILMFVWLTIAPMLAILTYHIIIRIEDGLWNDR